MAFQVIDKQVLSNGDTIKVTVLNTETGKSATGTDKAGILTGATTAAATRNAIEQVK